MKTLVLGSSSFAAQGLSDRLRADGHEVWTFNRSRPRNAGGRDLHGDYAGLARVAAGAADCDALINYALVKFGDEAANLQLTRHILAAARALRAKRFIHVSSISVLPAVRGMVNEDTPAVAHRWKGSYSRVKVAVEHLLDAELTDLPLVFVRPGFILADGLVDSMVGIGRLLPTGQVLGLGNRRSIIPLVSRDDVNTALARVAQMPPSAKRQVFMLVSPEAPTREEYLRFHCEELGRGRSLVHAPSWLWRCGLMFGSVALTVLKRRQFRLVKLFEHNLNVRHYDCGRTRAALGLDFRFDWPAALRRVAEMSPLGTSFAPAGVKGTVASRPVERLHYFGAGRIVQQKHFPGLVRFGFQGRLSVTDPGLETPPAAGPLRVEKCAATPEGVTHAVVNAPGFAREEIWRALPPSVTDVLVEKPFAASRAQFETFRSLLGGRRVFVIHNYRLKPNVLAFREFLRRRPPGALRRVNLHYETPSPALERAAWLRDEWRHRILLTDYALHYLDLSWALFDGPMTINRCDVRRNARGELRELSADVSFSQGAAALFLRQGAHQRQCLIDFVFDNYTAQLRFFPDCFQPIFGGHSAADDLRLFGGEMAATGRKVLEKLDWKTFDRSHDRLLAAFTGRAGPELLDEFSLAALTPFYERLTQLADVVYRD